MEPNIPNKITYYGIEFSNDMKVEKTEISVKNSIFSQYDSDHNGYFNGNEWENFVEVVQNEELAKQRAQNSKNATTIKKYQKKLDKLYNEINKLASKELNLFDNTIKFEEFNEKHDSKRLLQPLDDNEQPPKGAKVIDISAMGVGDGNGKIYKKAYIIDNGTLTDEEMAEYKDLLNKSLKEMQEHQKREEKLNKLSDEIQQYSLLAKMAEEGAISETQTDYDNNRIYENYSTRIRSKENPFWDQMNQLEQEINRLTSETKQSPNSENTKEKFKRIGQLRIQLKQLEQASQQWFTNTYSNQGNIKNPLSSIPDEALQKLKQNKTDPKAMNEEKLSPADIGSKKEEIQDKDEEKEKEKESKTEPEGETPVINPAFSHRVDSIVEDALGTPQNTNGTTSIGGDTKISSNLTGTSESNSGTALECKTSSLDNETDTTASASVGDSYQSDGFSALITSTHSIGMSGITQEDIINTVNTPQVAPTVTERPTISDFADSQSKQNNKENNFDFEKPKTDESNGKDVDFKDKTEDLLSNDKTTENGTSQNPVAVEPKKYDNSISGQIGFTQKYDSTTISMIANGGLNTSVTSDNLSLQGNVGTTITVSDSHNTAKIKAEVENSVSISNTESQVEISPVNGNVQATYDYNGEHLTVHAGGTMIFTGDNENELSMQGNEGNNITTQADVSANYNNGLLDISSNGSFEISDNSQTTNANITANYNGLSVNAGLSHNSESQTAPSVTIPDEFFNIPGLIPELPTEDSQSTNTQITTGTGYQDGNWDASVQYTHSDTNGDTSNTTVVQGKYTFDHVYIQNTNTFTDVSSTYSVGTGGTFNFQQNQSLSFNINPSIDVGYSTGDHSVLVNGGITGGLQYNHDNTHASLTVMESYTSSIYTDGSGSFTGNMVSVNGNISIGQFNIHGNFTHNYTYSNTSQNNQASSGSEYNLTDFKEKIIDMKADTPSGNNPTHSMTVGGGIGYTSGNTTVSANYSQQIGTQSSSPTVSVSVDIKLGGTKKKKLP